MNVPPATTALTAAQVADFTATGFVVLPGYFSPSEIADAASAISALAARSPRTGHEMAYFEDSVTEPGRRVLSRIEKFIEEDAVLRTLMLERGLAELAAQLLGAPALLFKEKINFKLPGGQGFAPHQDIQPGWDAYAPFFISVLVTIDPSTLANGCLELAAGHHRRGWLGEAFAPLTPAQLRGVEFVPYPTAPGDVVLFDCFTPHQSAPNLTDQPRRNLYLTYNRAEHGDWRARYFADKRAAFPPDHERAPGAEYRFKV